MHQCIGSLRDGRGQAHDSAIAAWGGRSALRANGARDRCIGELDTTERGYERHEGDDAVVVVCEREEHKFVVIDIELFKNYCYWIIALELNQVVDYLSCSSGRNNLNLVFIVYTCGVLQISCPRYSHCVPLNLSQPLSTSHSRNKVSERI